VPVSKSVFWRLLVSRRQSKKPRGGFKAPQNTSYNIILLVGADRCALGPQHAYSRNTNPGLLLEHFENAETNFLRD
jgi:hypothetical protein